MKHATRAQTRARTAAIARNDHNNLMRLAGWLMLASIVALLLMFSWRAEASDHVPLNKLAEDPSYSFLQEPLPQAHSFSANYLSGRFAQRQQDWSAAETYMSEAARRANDPAMLQRAFLLAVGAGRYDEAADMAAQIKTNDSAADVAHIFLASKALADGHAEAALAELKLLPDEGFGDFTKPLLTAWAQAAAGQYDAAQKTLTTTAQVKGAEGTFAFHRGMIAELAGDKQAAADAYVISMREGLSLHSALVIANFFDRAHAPEISAKIYKGVDKLFVSQPTLGAKPLVSAAPIIATPADGAALAIFDIASLLYERRAYDSAQIYASVAQLLSPQLAFAHLMLGDIAAINRHYDQSLVQYGAISLQSPLYWLSRLRAAEVHEAAGELPEAAEILNALADEPRTKMASLVALGDIYRRQKDFLNARAAYDRALAANPAPATKGPLLFARGMVLQNLGDAEGADRDLTAALAIDPDNATLLNYIGYTWLDRGTKTKEAFAMLTRAVKLAPDDGYVLDSYGWALYRQGDYAAAAGWLEKAVAAVPGDATILEHLGDTYWRQGRATEAQFQWKRASDLTQDAALRQQLEAKLQHGLAPGPERAQLMRADAKI